MALLLPLGSLLVILVLIDLVLVDLAITTDMRVLSADPYEVRETEKLAVGISGATIGDGQSGGRLVPSGIV